jgi:voltage-gated potassium channel
VSGLRIRSPSALVLTAVAQAGVMFGLYYALPLGRGGVFLDVLLIVGGTIGLFPLAVHHARRVVQSERPLVQAVQAATLLLTILLVTFSATYYELAHRVDGSMGGLDTKTDSLYFTITTLATVGYGDITPVSQPARAVASLQMLVDLAFLGLGVRILSRAVEHSRTRAASGPTP